MNILLVAATPFEIQPFISYLERRFVKSAPYRYQRGELGVSVLISGVGLPMMAYAMGRVLLTADFQLAINAGIAGAFQRKHSLGSVVQVVSERFADLGAQESDGRFTDIHEMELIPANEPPFSEGRLLNQSAEAFNFLPAVHGLSVNKVHGHLPDIAAILRKYPDAEVESMEGAAFFYACLQEKLPFLEIRAISNYVEARQRENWDIPLAIERLNQVLEELTASFF